MYLVVECMESESIVHVKAAHQDTVDKELEEEAAWIHHNTEERKIKETVT